MGPLTSVSHTEQVYTPEDRPNSTNLLETALLLHRQGLALLPIRPRSKRPHVPVLKACYGTDKWGHLAKQPAGEADVAKWFRLDRNCNIAVIAGPASGDVAFIDIDDPDGASKLLSRINSLGGPAVQTPRPGFRYWFRMREPIPNSNLYLPGGRKVGEILTGYDASGEIAGKYALVPPSSHPDGGQYRWLTLQRDSTAPLPEFSAADLASLLEECGVTAKASVASRKVDVASRKVAALPTSDTSKWCIDRKRPHDLPTSDTPPSYLRHLDAAPEKVRELLRSPDFIEAALRRLGLDGIEFGRSFRCVLPGHEENHASVTLFQLEDGSVLYHDFHERDGEQWYSLAEVYCAQVSGRVRKLSKPEHATWMLRLAVDAGVLQPAHVEAPKAPVDLPPSARTVYAGFLQLLAVKWLYTPNVPTAFSWKFASSWCGLPERQVGQAMRELLRRGLIRKVGEHRTAQGRVQTLFLPGLAVHQGGASKR